MRRSITRILFFVLAFNAFPFLALAQDAENPTDPYRIKGNVDDFSRWFNKLLDDFPKISNYNNNAVYSASRYSNSYKTYNDYDKAAQSPWVKQQMMQQLSTLATELANTAGTSSAPDSAAKLNTLSSKLSASNDKDFQAIGNDFQQEATYIRAGDTAGAEKMASAVASMPQPYVSPGYKPTNNESQMANTFSTVIAGLISALTGSIGSLAVTALLKALGIGGNGGSIDGTLTNAASSLARGQDASAVGQNTGSGLISGAGNTAQGQINDVTTGARNSINSSTSGGAPSSH